MITILKLFKMIDIYSSLRCLCMTSALLLAFTTNSYTQTLFEQLSITNYGSPNFPKVLGSNGWTIKSQDKIVEIGKFNADGRSDMLIQGASGLGIINLNSANELTTLTFAENGSKLDNSGWTISRNDNIKGVGYFHPNYKHDILIQNVNSLGVISLDGLNNFETTSMVSNGERFSGWKYNRYDKILGVGDFNNDNRSDFIIKSSTHLGIISIDNSGNFEAITSGANNHNLGDSGWRLNAGDVVLGIGDFNNDNRSDFIIKSNSHLGIMSLNNSGNYTNLAIGVNGYNLGNSGWRLNATDEILGVGDFNNDNKTDFIIKSSTHLGIMSLSAEGNYTNLAIAANNSTLGDSGWRLNTADEILGVGDFNGDGQTDFVIKSSTHLGIIGLNDLGTYTALIIKAGNYPSTTSPLNLWSAEQFQGVGDFNDDDTSDFIIKDQSNFGILTLKNDINRYLNVDDCLECTENQNNELSLVLEDMLGIRGGDPSGDFIGSAAARKPPRGKNWYPLDGNRKVLCGSYNRFAINAARPIRANSENDWNIFIIPHDNYNYLIEDARPYQYYNYSWHNWQECDGVPCMEAEITPPKELNDYEDFSIENVTSSLLSNQDICVYGPWVREEVHGNRPEIHPSELLWWENDEGIKHMLIVQDGSDRYDEKKNFYGEPDRGWRAWAGAPMIKQFKIAFSVEVNAETEQYTLDIGRSLRVNTSSNASVSEDIFSGRRYGLEKNGEIPILVIETSRTDRYLGVQFDSVCYNSVTNRLTGYILIKAQIGERDKLGAFLEIILKKENVVIRR